MSARGQRIAAKEWLEEVYRHGATPEADHALSLLRVVDQLTEYATPEARRWLEEIYSTASLNADHALELITMLDDDDDDDDDDNTCPHCGQHM